MKIVPKGHFVLVEVKPVEETTKSGIVIATAAESKREHNGRDIGVIKAFGPTAYKGFAGCESPADWGVSVGDLVEFNRYNGKIPRSAETNKSMKNLRIITDNEIIAGVED